MRTTHSGDSAGDVCMSVDVLALGTYAWGVRQSGPFRDAPASNSGWPNYKFSESPFLSVWLR